MKNKLLILIFLIIVSYFCFMSANPWSFDFTKYKIYEYINSEYSLKTYNVTKNNIYEIIKKNNFYYPFIIKPEFCNGANNGVFKINSELDLEKYFSYNYDTSYIIQEYYYPKYEVGLLYERFPYEENGKIISIVLKNKNKNETEWKSLKCGNIYNNENTICLDSSNLKSKKLSHIINLISKNIPNFFAGRYDIGFNNIDDFKDGKNFKIYELNGVMGFDLRFNFTQHNIIHNIPQILLIIRWIFIRIYIGFINIICFNGNIKATICEYNKRNKYYTHCKNYEMLLQPSSA